MKHGSVRRFIVFFFAYGFLYFPLALLVIYSFNGSKYVAIWTHCSFKWYQSLFSNTLLLSAFKASMIIAFASATLAVILGTAAALVFTRFPSFKTEAFLKSLCLAPLVLPEIILGIGFLLAFIALNEWFYFPPGRGYLTVIIAHSTLGMAYVFMIVKVQLRSLNQAYIDAALDLGASPLKTFFTITFPIIFPSIAAGWLLAFVLSFDDLVVASFVAGTDVTTLPMAIFSSVRFGVTPEINVLGTLIILFISLLSTVAFLVARRRQRA